MSRGIPVRNAQGQIVDVVSPELFATANLIDEAEPFAAAPPPAPDGNAPPSQPATPRRRTGETPTVFQLRPPSIPPHSTARSPLQEVVYVIVGMSIVGLLILGIWSWRLQSGEAPRVAPVADLTPTETTPGVPTATLVMPTIPVAAVAYDAPGGVVLGAIEPGRRCTPSPGALIVRGSARSVSKVGASGLRQPYGIMCPASPQRRVPRQHHCPYPPTYLRRRRHKQGIRRCLGRHRRLIGNHGRSLVVPKARMASSFVKVASASKQQSAAWRIC